MNKIELFLQDLAELTKKHGIKIDGCGCCGSPWLEDNEMVIAEDLVYDEKAEKYTVCEH